MGLRFRKSIKLGGGFKINISKSGIGYSWGIPGYRITKNAKGGGRSTLSIPGTGLSYSHSIGGSKRKNTNGKTERKQIDNSADYGETTLIQSADISNFQDVNHLQLLENLQKTKNLFNLLTTIAIVCIFFFLGLVKTYIVISLVLLFIAVILLVYNFKCVNVNLEYEIDEDTQNKYDNQCKEWEKVKKCNGKWIVLQSQEIINSKTHAGASSQVRRRPLKMSNKLPCYIKCNIQPVSIVANKEKFYFLPDKIIILKNGKYGAIDNKIIETIISTSHFVEYEHVPSDAKIIDYTWKYVNKNGTRDKRYNDNRKLPVCQYSNINITSDSGLKMRIMVSNVDATKDFNLK